MDAESLQTASYEETIRILTAQISRRNALITELCDALDITTQLLLVSELPTYVVENKISENRLMQKRAREATR